MEFAKLIYDGEYYSYRGSSNLKMDILGLFFRCELRYGISSYKDWVFDDASISACGNITALEKVDGHIYMSDLLSEEKDPTELIMTIEQFVQLLDDWDNKVCKLRPKEVLIKYENDQFIIETRNED